MSVEEIKTYKLVCDGHLGALRPDRSGYDNIHPCTSETVIEASSESELYCNTPIGWRLSKILQADPDEPLMQPAFRVLCPFHHMEEEGR